MANIWPNLLPNGRMLWVVDAMPSAAGDGSFTAGDYLLNISSGPQGGLYRCATTGTGATAVFTQSTAKTVVDGLTALANGGQTGATALTADWNRVTTVASAADSVMLPPAVVGKSVFVANAAATNSMNVFPASGEYINILSQNAALAVAAGKAAEFRCIVTGKWSAILSA